MKKKLAVLAVAALAMSTAYAQSCVFGCYTFPNLWKGLTHVYPCSNGKFNYMPYYQDQTEGDNVTLVFQPTAGGTITNIVNGHSNNGGPTDINWSQAGGKWTGHPTNFQPHTAYEFAIYATGANCTVQGQAQ